METFDLRHSGAVELATDGQTVVSRAQVYRRGLLTVGRQLQAEREADKRAGRQHRALNVTEQRALLEAQNEDLGRRA